MVHDSNRKHAGMLVPSWCNRSESLRGPWICKAPGNDGVYISFMLGRWSSCGKEMDENRLREQGVSCCAEVPPFTRHLARLRESLVMSSASPCKKVSLKCDANGVRCDRSSMDGRSGSLVCLSLTLF